MNSPALHDPERLLSPRGFDESKTARRLLQPT
jgi:phosphohistidine phosphatase SixA